jgi:hypothetical protein
MNTIVTMKLTIPLPKGGSKEIDADIPIFEVKEIGLAITEIAEKEKKNMAIKKEEYNSLNITMKISDSENLFESSVFNAPSSARSKIIFTVCEIINEELDEVIFNMNSYDYEVVKRVTKSCSSLSNTIMKSLGGENKQDN